MSDNKKTEIVAKPSKKFDDAVALISKALGVEATVVTLTSGDAEGWITSGHLADDAVIAFELTGARIYRTEGGAKPYALGYTVKLMNDIGDGSEEAPKYKAGQTVILGERHRLRVLRNLRAGALCAMRVIGKKEIGNSQSLLMVDVVGGDSKTPGEAIANMIALSMEEARQGRSAAADPWDMDGFGVK